MSLATLPEYEARYGTASDPVRVANLLTDASSLVQNVANRHIEKVTGDTVSLEGGGDNVVFLPETPVLGVTSVTVSGTLLAASKYDWWEYGMLVRNDGVFPN